MKKAFPLLMMAFLFSCGGGGVNTQDVGISDSVSRVIQDVQCCSQLDNETGECLEFIPAQAQSWDIQIKNQSDEFFGEDQPVQVKNCSFELIPLSSVAPDIDDANKYFSCNTPTIESNSTGTVTISMSQSLVDLMKDYYNDLQKTLSYRLIIHLEIEGYNSGTYDTDTYTDIDFTDVNPGQVCEE